MPISTWSMGVATLMASDVCRNRPRVVAEVRGSYVHTFVLRLLEYSCQVLPELQVYVSCHDAGLPPSKAT